MRLSTNAKANILERGVKWYSAAHMFTTIYIYTGPPPANADTAATGTLLYKDERSWTNSGYDAANGKIIIDSGSPRWSSTPIATGTAGWFRLSRSDEPTSYTRNHRIDGTITDASASVLGDLVLDTTAMVSGVGTIEIPPTVISAIATVLSIQVAGAFE